MYVISVNLWFNSALLSSSNTQLLLYTCKYLLISSIHTHVCVLICCSNVCM